MKLRPLDDYLDPNGDVTTTWYEFEIVFMLSTRMGYQPIEWTVGVDEDGIAWTYATS